MTPRSMGLSRRAVVVAGVAVSAKGLPAPQPLTVAAAANLKPALDRIIPPFEAAHRGVEVRATYGATGTLFAQLSNGAPFDLFLAADLETPRRLVGSGVAREVVPYATGRLVLWIPRSAGLGAGKGLELLRHPRVSKVAIADPAVAPYGRAARQVLEGAGLFAAVKDRLVVGQNVAQAAQFAQSGNAQAAFVALSMAMAPPLSTEGDTIPIPASSHEPLTQGAAVVEASPRRELARSFLTFLTGREGRTLLEASGYGSP